jgi:hypothetical protein
LGWHGREEETGFSELPGNEDISVPSLISLRETWLRE